ncbi:MAG: biotin synthase BioB [Phycisphaerae bacterium]|nr:biotin synthase BioB [Phycisphaerae bacterium]
MSQTQTLAHLAQAVLDGESLSAEQAMRLAELAAAEPWEAVFWAHRVRRKHFGNQVRFCSIVPGRLGACPEDCKWCAQSLAWSRPGKGGAAEAMPSKPRVAPRQEILDAAQAAWQNGAACIGIVNSGRRPSARDLAAVVDAAAAIQSDKACGGGVCASLGAITPDQARLLAQAGVRRYHHNLETSRAFFPSMVTTHRYEERLATLAAARSAGMSLCCGGIFGVGETWADRVELALTLRDEVGPEVVPLNFLHPIPGTPLEHASPLPPTEILAIIAVYRLLLPTADIKVAGGRSVNLRDLQSWIFHAGATSVMVGNYLTTPGREVPADRQMVQDLGLTLVKAFQPPPAERPVPQGRWG